MDGLLAIGSSLCGRAYIHSIFVTAIGILRDLLHDHVSIVVHLLFVSLCTNVHMQRDKRGVPSLRFDISFPSLREHLFWLTVTASSFYDFTDFFISPAEAETLYT